MALDAGEGREGLVAQINVTPMVDVMLVLLIIFMVIGPWLQSGVTVQLAKAKNADLTQAIISERSAVISVPETGSYYVGREPVPDIEAIPYRVTRILSDKPPSEQLVYIKASNRVKYGEIVEIVERLRNARPLSWDRIGLVVEESGTNNETREVRRSY